MSSEDESESVRQTLTAATPSPIPPSTTAVVMLAPRFSHLPVGGFCAIPTSRSYGSAPLSFVSPSGQVFLAAPFPPPVVHYLPPHSINQNSVIFPSGKSLVSTTAPSLPQVVSPSKCIPSIPQSLQVHSSLTPQSSSGTTEPVQISKPALLVPTTPVKPALQTSFFMRDPLNKMLSSSIERKQLEGHKEDDEEEDTSSSSATSMQPLISANPALISGNGESETASRIEEREISLKQLLKVESSRPHQDTFADQLRDEVDLTRFYKCFKGSKQSDHLDIDILPTVGDSTLKWLQVRQKCFHIDPELGPVIVARVLVSSSGLLKFQLLFPVYKTVYTKLFVEKEMEGILAELSHDHVICPGLPGYKDKFSVLGYHPSHVRVLETTHVQRYDHEDCPIWHVPSMTYSKSNRTIQNMCKQCKYLQNSMVRLATKACEVDPAERESWTDPSSNRPLIYMSAADREERYRKLRQERTQLLVKLRAYEERFGIG